MTAPDHPLPHVVTGLISQAGRTGRAHQRLGPATAGHDRPRPCGSRLRLFDPDVDLLPLSPRKVAPVLYDTKGDTGRVILDTLRASMRPLTTAQVCEAVMKARDLDTNDKALCRVMMRRTNANLKHWQKKRGLIRSMPGPGQQLLWEVAFLRGCPEIGIFPAFWKAHCL